MDTQDQKERTLTLVPSNWPGSPVELSESPISIGRDKTNTVCIQDEKASRHHCVIERDGSGGFRVRDLGSRNGTRVNSSRKKEASLSGGEVLRIGDHEFLVEVKGEDDSVPLANGSASGVAMGGSRAGVDWGAGGGAAGGGGGAAGFWESMNDATAWAGDLEHTIDFLPPKDEREEIVTLLDAGGRISDALLGAGEGSKAVRLLVQLASKSRATDIHAEPKGDHALVRMRVDGQMVTVVEMPNKVLEMIGGLIKTACQMKTAGKDAVQDGHFSTRFADRNVDYRVSFTPSVHGQKMVMRVLDPRGMPGSLDDLGLAAYMLEKVKKVCEKDHGLLIVCGPTGSGKTTTLHNCLRQIDRASRNVITIEDPVEYQLEGVTQIPTDENKGNTFGALLRSVLRQDPDVIMVGEIRDEETARTAMQAAMTGHVVFSTLHAKDSVGAIFRLLDLKVEPYLVANSLDLVLAQRLVRVLCESCKRESPMKPGEMTRAGRYLGGKTKAFLATGCARCLRTGYRGRRALFELLYVNDDLRDVILREPSVGAIKKVIEHGLFTTLTQSGWRLVAEGVTTMDEVDRVAGMG